MHVSGASGQAMQATEQEYRSVDSGTSSRGIYSGGEGGKKHTERRVAYEGSSRGRHGWGGKRGVEGESTGG